MARQALAVLDDPSAFRPIGEAAADLIRRRYSQDTCIPQLAERLQSLAFASGRPR
jgi:hypothetical protein